MNAMLRTNGRSAVFLYFSPMRKGALSIVLVAATACLPVAAQEQPNAADVADAPLAERYPAGSIQSVETADQAKVEVEQERLRVESRFASEEAACYPKFFTTACLDKAKEKRRLALNRIRAVEVEANAVKRRLRVEKRDEALAKKNQEDARKQEERNRRTSAAQAEGAETAPRAEGSRPESGTVGAGNAVGVDERVIKHEALQAERAAKDAANAQKRAENERKFARKQQEAEERQRSIAAKKAEKAREAANESGTETQAQDRNQQVLPR
jgi:colicin import membrane protein